MNRFNKVFLSVSMILLISGCSSSHSGFEKYPYKTLNESYPLNSSYNVNKEWWKGYNDAELNQYVEIALKNNIDLAQAAIKVNQALYQANLVGSDLTPTFNGSLGASASKNIKDGSNSNQSFNGSVGVSYELDLWKKLADATSAKEWTYKATQQDLEEAKLALINSIVDVYFNLRYLKEIYSITESNLNTYNEIYKITELKYKNGAVSNLDVIQAQQAIDNAKNNLNSLALQINNQEMVMKNLLNYQPKNTLYFSDKSIMDINLQGVDLNIPVYAISNRPDLKSKEYALVSSFKDKKSVEKEMYPSVSISSTLSSSNNKFNNALNIPVGGISLNISLPFLDWERIKWNNKLSEENFKSVKLDFEKGITTALNEIDNYYFTYQNYQTNFNNVQNQYNDAVKIEKYYKIRYDQGASQMLDWLNAIQTTNNSKQSIVEAKYKLLSGENNVYKAMAGKYR